MKQRDDETLFFAWAYVQVDRCNHDDTRVESACARLSQQRIELPNGKVLVCSDDNWKSLWLRGRALQQSDAWAAIWPVWLSDEPEAIRKTRALLRKDGISKVIKSAYVRKQKAMKTVNTLT